jgi:hypothetical protein
MNSSTRLTIPAAILFFVLAVLFLNFVVPPFQNPDEPQHFGGIMVEALGEGRQEAVEQEIIKMMDKHHWWRFVGIGRPPELPKRLADISFLMGHYPLQDFKQRLAGIRFYHLLFGNIFRFFGIEDVTFAYYLCRLTSLFLTLGALVFLCLTLQLFRQDLQGLFLPGLFFVLFLPQFLISSLAVNSDALANFIGALFFWAAASLFAGKGKKHLLFSLLFLSVAVGFLVDRSTFILVPLALLVPFFLVGKKKFQESIVNLLAFFVVFLFLAVLLIKFSPFLADNNLRMFGLVFQRFSRAAPMLFSLGEGSRQFLTFIVDSFLLKFGWALFGAGAGVYYVWRLAVTLSLAGIFIFLGRKGWNFVKGWPEWMEKLQRSVGIKPSSKLIHRRIRHLRHREKPASSGGGTEEKMQALNNAILTKLAVFSMVAVLFQILAAWTYYGSHQMLAQGRHFFPFLIPIVLLFVLGMKSFFESIRSQAAGIALTLFVLAEFFLLNYVIWARMIPYFHLVIKSPYPGL